MARAQALAMMAAKDAFEADRRDAAKRMSSAAGWRDRVATYQRLESEHLARAVALYRTLGGKAQAPAVAEVVACSEAPSLPTAIAFPDAVAILAADLAELP